jgi:hypothetical protein
MSDEINSSFRLRARGDGTLAVVEIVATLDHGDESDITSFIVAHAAEPAIAGGECEWRSDGVIVLKLVDPADTNQATMLGFLYLALLSGRFDVPADVQALIFPAP